MRHTLLIISLIFATGYTYAQMEWSAQSQVQLGKQANSWKTGVRMNARNILLTAGLRLAIPKDGLNGGPNNFGTATPNGWSQIGGYYVQLGIPIAVMPDSGWYIYTFMEFERFSGTQQYSWMERESANSAGNITIPFIATGSSEMFALNIHFLTEFRINDAHYVFAGIQYGESRYKTEFDSWYRSGMSNVAFYFGYRFRIKFTERKVRAEKV